MKYYSMRLFLLAVAFAILPLYESGAASVDDILGRTYLEIEPGFAYRLAYEDNIDYDRDGKDRINGWSNHYGPEVNISLKSPRFSLNSNAMIDIAEYTSEKDFNYVNQYYGLNFGYIPTERLEFSLGTNYTVISDNERYEDIGAIDPTDEYVRYKNKTNDFLGGLTYQLTPRSSIALTGNFAHYDSISTAGSEFYSLVALYTYNLSSRTDLLLNTAYFYYDFKGNDATFSPDEVFYEYSRYSYEMKNYSIMGGIEHKFENDGKVLAQFGLRYSDTDSSEQTDTGTVDTSGTGNGWVGVLEYQKRFNDFLFGFEASQDVTVSPEGANYQSTSLLSRTEYSITQRLLAGLDLRVVRAYADESDAFVGSSRDSLYYIVQSSLRHQTYRWLTTSLIHQFLYSKDKDNNDSSYHTNLFYVEFRFIPLRNVVLR